MAGDFDETLENYGFKRVREKADQLHHIHSTEGSVTFRRGHVRIEVSGSRMGVSRGQVVFYLTHRLELAICAIVTDAARRNEGHATRALKDLLSALKEMEYEYVWLEPCPIKKQRPVLDRDALTAWYKRFGFAAHDEDGWVMVLERATA